MKTKNIAGCVLAFAAAVLAVGCGRENTAAAGIVPFPSLAVRPLAALPDENIARRTFIPLDASDPQYFFNRADNIKVRDGKIYLLFWNRHNDTRLLVFDMQGKGVLALDRRGEGPEEYAQISAFDVDRRGNIHIVDGNRDQLLVYGPHGDFIRRQDLPYEADDIRCLPTGDYLLALCNWNRKQAAGRKVVLAAPDLSVKKAYFRYADDLDANFILDSNGFTDCGDGMTAYNESMNGHIYLFGRQGELADSLYVDFGSRTIPEKEKSDIEKNIWKNSSYLCLSGSNAVLDGSVAGNMYSRRKFAYVIDRSGGIVYSDFGEKYSDALSIIVGVTDDGSIVSCIRPEMFQMGETSHIPDSVKEFVGDENFALCITKLK